MFVSDWVEAVLTFYFARCRRLDRGCWLGFVCCLVGGWWLVVVHSQIFCWDKRVFEFLHRC